MKKRLLALFSLIVITNGVNAMKSPPVPGRAFEQVIPPAQSGTLSPADKIAALKTKYNYIRDDGARLGMILIQLIAGMHTHPEEALPTITLFLAQEQISPHILGKALVIAIERNFYNVAMLLLEHGASITDEARKAADDNLITHADDRYVKLLEAREAR
jgi:hypothetical protein